MKQELFGTKAAAGLLMAAALSTATASSAWAAANDYTPLGIKNGPFTIFLNGGVGIEYNDNIFALSDPAIAAINSFGIDEDEFLSHLKLGVEAKGKFSGGSTLDLYARGHYGAHFDYDFANFTDATVGLNSRTFFSKAVSLRAKSEYAYEHEEYGLAEALGTGVVGDEPVTLSKVTGNLALEFKPGRTGFAVGAAAIGRFYNDQELALGNRSLEHRNYWDVDYFAEFSQDIDKTTGFFLKVNGNGRAYPDRNGFQNRDSNGVELTAGARVKATGTINLEAYAGYLNQGFDDSDFETINDFIFGGNMKWNPSAFFEMKVDADRSIQETVSAGQSSFIRTTGETTLSVFPLENLTFWTTGRYTNRDYQQSISNQQSVAPVEREDDILFGELGGEFKVNRNVGLSLYYNVIDRDVEMTNVVGDADFTRQKVMFEINLAR